MITNIELEEQALKIGLPLAGVFSKDQLPQRRSPGAYIVNLQDATDEHGNFLPGSHWVGFYVEGKQACYFDSFAFKSPVQVHNFLRPYRPYAVNNKQIQNVRSEVCGYYVLYFLFFMHKQRKIRSLAKRLDLFLRQFSDDPQKNLVILKRLIKPL